MGVDAHHSLRLSVGWSSTGDDVDAALGALPGILADLRALARYVASAAVGKLYVVRHADAGQRSQWDGPDSSRPLSHGGERQADGLADILAEDGITRLLASPFTRCVQTLEPLGKRLGLPVEADERLAEGTGA